MQRNSADRTVVVVGASAGAQTALEAFFAAVPADCKACFVVVVHMPRGHRSMLAELLDKHVELPVHAAADGQLLADGLVFVAPPGTAVLPNGVELRVETLPDDERRHPINRTLAAFAEQFGPRTTAVILSGTGADGAQGAERTKQAGGRVYVQDRSALFEDMPRSAAATGAVDAELPPHQIAEHVTAQDGNLISPPPPPEVSADKAKAILDKLEDAHGRLQRNYGTENVRRCVRERMAVLRLDSVDTYEKVLERGLEERVQLLRAMLVRDSRFFDVASDWESLAEELRNKLDEGRVDSLLRVWVIGCGTGEEAFSVAMLVDEVIRATGRRLAFKVFASDVDRDALSVANAAIYSGIENDVDPTRLATYFKTEGNRYRAANSLRHRIVFVPHDATKDPPFTRIHLVVCRNLASLLTQASRDTIWRNVCFALREHGLLFTNHDEEQCTSDQEFKKTRPGVFRRTARTRYQSTKSPPPSIARALPAGERRLLTEICLALLRQTGGHAAVIIDEHRRVVHTLGDISGVLRLPQGTLSDRLDVLAAPAIRSSVLSLCNVATRSGELVRKLVDQLEAGSATDIGLTAQRLPELRGEGGLMLITFEERQRVDGAVPRAQTVETAESGPGGPMERLEHELADTQADLSATIRELENANNELSTTNHELASANEELESANEELHSVNEELHTFNEDYKQQLLEKEGSAADLDNLLDATDVGIIFLDALGRVRRATPAATRVIPVREADNGRHLGEIHHSLKDVDLLGWVNECLQSGKTLEREASSRGGGCFLIRLSPYRNLADIVDGAVVSLVDISAMHDARMALAESEERFRQLAEHIDSVLWIRAAGHAPEERRLLYVGPPFRWLWHRNPEAAVEDPEVWFSSVHPEDRPAVKIAYDRLEEDDLDIEYRLHLDDGATVWIRDRGFPIRGNDGEVVRFAGIASDITRVKRQESLLRETAQGYRELASHDALTGLLNRRGLEDLLEVASTGHNSDRHGTIAMLIDCDDFKSINDRFGYAVGDHALRAMAARFQKALRPTDFLARIGGDEFVALLCDSTLDGAVQAAERVRASIAEEPIDIAENVTSTTVSIGVGPVPSNARTAEQVVEAIQTALRLGKSKGKDRVVVVGKDVHPDGGAELAQQLANGEIELSVVHQPIHALDDGRIVGREYLTRGPDGEGESPQHLLRISARHGYLRKVDLRCFHNCLSVALAGAKDDSDIHINLHPSTLMSTGLTDLIPIDILNRSAKRICVEIGEQLLMDPLPDLRERVEELQAAGVRFSLDDVGFGRNTLAAVVVLEPDIVKIDPSLVTGCAGNRKRIRWLRRITTVAKSLDCELIAEGIETEADRQAVWGLGIARGQGFHWERASETSRVKPTDDRYPGHALPGA